MNRMCWQRGRDFEMADLTCFSVRSERSENPIYTQSEMSHISQRLPHVITFGIK
jgi:hypothetical protein